MDFGVSYFPTDYAIEPAELARMCEQRGFESFYVTEHTHIPASRETPYPAGGELPREYFRIHDPFVSLAMAAEATEQIKIGTAICLVVERDPIVTAKEVASLDRLSGGRVIFGVGAGWNLEEMANHGTDPSTRFGLLRERVEAMKLMWTEEEPEYHGKYVDFDPIHFWPKPLQDPHPPVLLGGYGPTVLDRVIAFADAWLPIRAGSDDDMIARIGELQGKAEEAGRDPIPVTLQIPPREPERVARYEEAGVNRCMYMLRPEDAASPATAERKLDEWAGRVREYAAAA